MAFTISKVSGAGDINNDGYDDVIIKGPNIYVIYGKESGFSNIDLASLTNAEGFYISGSACSVSDAGDINGDGIDDMIVGRCGESPNSKSEAGTSYIVFGKSTGFSNINLASLTSDLGFAIYGANSGDYSGNSVSAAGDVNKDGYDDIIIGAQYADPNSRTGAGISGSVASINAG